MSDPERKSERPNQVIIMAPEDAPIMDRAKVVSDFREILGKSLTDPEEIELTVERMKRLFPVEGVVIVPRTNAPNSEGIILEVTEDTSGAGFLRFDVGVTTQEGMRNKSVMAKGLLDLNPEGAKENPLSSRAPLDPKKRYILKGQVVMVERLSAGGHYALVSKTHGMAEWASCAELRLATDAEQALTPVHPPKPTRPRHRVRKNPIMREE